MRHARLLRSGALLGAATLALLALAVTAAAGPCDDLRVKVGSLAYVDRSQDCHAAVDAVRNPPIPPAPDAPERDLPVGEPENPGLQDAGVEDKLPTVEEEDPPVSAPGAGAGVALFPDGLPEASDPTGDPLALACVWVVREEESEAHCQEARLPEPPEAPSAWAPLESADPFAGPQAADESDAAPEPEASSASAAAFEASALAPAGHAPARELSVAVTPSRPARDETPVDQPHSLPLAVATALSLLAVGVGLYHRLRRAPILSATRAQILDIVRARPGLTLTELGRRTGVTRRTAAYHARVLAAEGAVVLEGFGNQTLVYANGAVPCDLRRPAAVLQDDRPRRFLEALLRKPTASLREVAREANLPVATAHGCAARLEREGLLETRRGAATRFELSQRARSLLGQAST